MLFARAVLCRAVVESVARAHERREIRAPLMSDTPYVDYVVVMLRCSVNIYVHALRFIARHYAALVTCLIAAYLRAICRMILLLLRVIVER